MAVEEMTRELVQWLAGKTVDEKVEDGTIGGGTGGGDCEIDCGTFGNTDASIDCGEF